MKKKSPVTHFRLGQMYMIKKDYIRARQEFKTTIVQDPDMKDAYRKLADSCMVLGDYDEALANYEKAHEFFPDDLELAMSLAICYDGKEEVQKAIDVLLDIKSKKTDYDMVNYNLAYGYNSQQNFTEALKFVDEELKYFPTNEMAIELKNEIEKSLEDSK